MPPRHLQPGPTGAESRSKTLTLALVASEALEWALVEAAAVTS